MVAGFLNSNVLLQYIVEFSDGQFDNITTNNTSYLLTGIEQGTNLEVTITPTLLLLELTGPPSSKTVNFRKLFWTATCTLTPTLYNYYVHKDKIYL